MISALFSFLGGAAFRYLLGRAMDWLEAKQKFREEQARLAQQEQFSAAAHVRQLEQMRLANELGLKEIQIKGDVELGVEEARAFTEAMKNAHAPTGNKYIDAWNGSVRPASATIALLIWLGKIVKAGFAITQWDQDLASSIIGFYFADRHMGKRKS